MTTGHYIPEKIVHNRDLEKILDTTHEWIFNRSGIEERRISEISSCEMALKLIEPLKGESIDYVLCASSYFEESFPSMATQVAASLNLNCPAMDIQAACSGFIYGLDLSACLLEKYKKILLIASEKTSAFLNWQDRGSAVLFGDGAGFFLLEQSQKFKKFQLYSEGSKGSILSLKNSSTIHMEGREVFKEAVTTLIVLIQSFLEKEQIDLKIIDHFIFHQANKRILSAVAEKLQLNENKIYLNLNKYANTASASIPILFHEKIQEGVIQRGDKILFAAFGGGLTAGVGMMEY